MTEFFGQKIAANSKATAFNIEEREINLSRASLTQSAKDGDVFVELVNRKTKESFTICKLNSKNNFSTQLDIVIRPSTTMVSVKGASEVHLTGYSEGAEEEADELPAAKRQKVEEKTSKSDESTDVESAEEEESEEM